MQINLRNLVKEREALKAAQAEVSKDISTKLNKVINFYDEIERDLEISGECIVQLDKPRLKAIEERNKMLNFLKQADDI